MLRKCTEKSASRPKVVRQGLILINDWAKEDFPNPVLW